ncbi:MAG: ParB/RepB/Spo0J family partition protein [Pseudomonadota bacterium]|nr:ParB/RepB/Spo0J family partition protein [Pseudomonadota bacterium]
MVKIKTDNCLLSDIDFADRSFPFSYGLLPARLETSIAVAGLLQPPLLVAADNGFKIVCGRRRLEVIRKTADESGKIPVYLAKNSSFQELFRRALWENLAIREFNPVETADIYTAALKLFTVDEIEKEIMPVLKLPLKPRFRMRCQAIAGFSRKLRDLLAAGSVDVETVDLIKGWSAEERTALVDLVAEAGLRRNKLREVVSRLDDLACRDEVSPLAPLFAARKAALNEAGGIDVELLRSYLKARLYPKLTAAHLEFATRQEKFPWLNDLRLDPPPDFEGGEYRLSFTFTGSKEWKKICDKLASVALEDIDELCHRP